MNLINKNNKQIEVLASIDFSDIARKVQSHSLETLNITIFIKIQHQTVENCTTKVL